MYTGIKLNINSGLASYAVAK